MKFFILIFSLFILSCSSTQEYTSPVHKKVETSFVSYAFKPQLAKIVKSYIDSAGTHLNVDVSELDLPKIVVFTHEEMKEIFKNNEITEDTYLYNFYYKSIFVSDRLTDKKIQDPFIRALLLHEIVHYVQHFRTDLSNLNCLTELQEDAIIMQYYYLYHVNAVRNVDIHKYAKENSICKDNYNPFRDNPSLQVEYLEYIKNK